MAEVTNPSPDALVVPFYGLRFAAGETKTVDDEVARTLGEPLEVAEGPAVTPAPAPAPAAPPAVEDSTAGQAEETPAPPAEGNAQ